MSARTQADFREMVEKRRLTHADEIYHEWVEQLFKERDAAQKKLTAVTADRDGLWEKFKDANLTISRMNQQRRDFTLTAKYGSGTLHDWRLYDINDKEVVYLGEDEQETKRLERWSREGALSVKTHCAGCSCPSRPITSYENLPAREGATAEPTKMIETYDGHYARDVGKGMLHHDPETCVTCAKPPDVEPSNGGGVCMQCGDIHTPKPPAPDLAALRRHCYRYDAKPALIDAILEYIDAIIKAAREVK